MRRIVCDFVGAAIDRKKPELEQFIVGHLECPESVPLIFTDPNAVIGGTPPHQDGAAPPRRLPAGPTSL